LNETSPALQASTGAPAPRPLRREDIPALARLFFKVFRDERCAPTPEFEAYLARFLLEHPAFEPTLSTLVQEDANGRIVAAMGYVPMPLHACGREITARLMSAYMADPAAPPGMGGRLGALTRARRQDFAFSNNAAPRSADATRAGGGIVLPLQSMDWHRRFRPLAAFLASRLEAPSKRPSPLAPLARALARPVDALARVLWPGLRSCPAPDAHVRPVAREIFLAEAPGMVARFAVRPRWAPEELDWLLDMAARKTANGPLHQVGIHDDAGTLLGLALYYARPGAVVEVLNILTREKAEQRVLRALFCHLDAAGHSAVRGEAQPFLMPSLFLERSVSLKFRGNFCVLTRHPDIADAVARGDFYSGGLVGESWSRLVTDFW
jgi:hypothetical protein